MRAEGPNLGVLHDQMGFFQDACCITDRGLRSEGGRTVTILGGSGVPPMHKKTDSSWYSQGIADIADVSRQRRGQPVAKTRPLVGALGISWDD